MSLIKSHATCSWILENQAILICLSLLLIAISRAHNYEVSLAYCFSHFCNTGGSVCVCVFSYLIFLFYFAMWFLNGFNFNKLWFVQIFISTNKNKCLFVEIFRFYQIECHLCEYKMYISILKIISKIDSKNGQKYIILINLKLIMYYNVFLVMEN